MLKWQSHAGKTERKRRFMVCWLKLKLTPDWPLPIESWPPGQHGKISSDTVFFFVVFSGMLEGSGKTCPAIHLDGYDQFSGGKMTHAFIKEMAAFVSLACPRGGSLPQTSTVTWGEARVNPDFYVQTTRWGLSPWKEDSERKRSRIRLGFVSWFRQRWRGWKRETEQMMKRTMTFLW